ncbi:hypothetical protein MTR67_043028 [Solanum verrucosum]|uniref:Mitochondrial protein n=1 Tax=Solanum verrucosum TaxID=315347 RepID=A0AAF0UN06_SOLVR|nr:hypothetical protein MTR67_043028 [Solanum verrucosum]
MLVHKTYGKGIEVDQTKIEVINKLPSLISVKGVRSFLGHAGFYRWSIKDISKVVIPLCRMLEKESSLEFDVACLRASVSLNEKLVSPPILIVLDSGGARNFKKVVQNLISKYTF